METWDRLRDTFSRYLLTTGRSNGTARTYCFNMDLFWRHCAKYEITPFEADRQMIRGWISDRQATVSSGRAHNDLAALRVFYAWLRETRYRDDDPTTNIRVKRTRTLPTEPLSSHEYEAMLSAADGERERLMLMLLGSTGMRISELSSLRVEDINWQRGEIRIIGKGDKERRLTPAVEVLNRLHAFCGMFGSGSPFVSKYYRRPLSANGIRKLIYDCAARAGLEGIHPHRFRSFFATTFIEQHADIQALQGVMGHENIQTSARYS